MIISVEWMALSEINALAWFLLSAAAAVERRQDWRCAEVKRLKPAQSLGKCRLKAVRKIYGTECVRLGARMWPPNREK
jgi:hypothetical protein